MAKIINVKNFVILANEIPLYAGTRLEGVVIIVNTKNWTIEKMANLKKYDKFPSLNSQGELIYYYYKMIKNKYHIFVGEKSIYSSEKPITNISVYNKP